MKIFFFSWFSYVIKEVVFSSNKTVSLKNIHLNYKSNSTDAKSADQSRRIFSGVGTACRSLFFNKGLIYRGINPMEIQLATHQWIQSTPYVCNERILDGLLFKSNEIFLQRSLTKTYTPNIHAYFGTFWVKIGQVFDLLSVFEDP